MDLNCQGPLTWWDFCSLVNTTGLHDPRLAVSADAEPRVWRNRGEGGLTTSYTWIFSCMEVWHPNPASFSRVNCSEIIRLQSPPSKDERGIFTGESKEWLKTVILNSSCAVESPEELGNPPVLWPQAGDSSVIDLGWHHGYFSF